MSNPYRMQPPPAVTTPSIFVSYHHHRDGAYYDDFSEFFHHAYGIVRDNSVDREIDSDDVEYVIRQIREEYIAGTSCTIVLCGAETYLRKFVDWEIKATLDDHHGLIGIYLPTAPRTESGAIVVPARLHDNIQSRYALFHPWSSLTANNLRDYLSYARSVSRSLIRNDQRLRSRNG